ncbi:hypothetical protein ACJW30_07G038100 [Castanea mollissima]
MSNYCTSHIQQLTSPCQNLSLDVGNEVHQMSSSVYFTQRPHNGALSSSLGTYNLLNQSSSQHTMQEDGRTNITTQGFTEMLNLIQTQLPKTVNQKNNEDIESQTQKCACLWDFIG